MSNFGAKHKTNGIMNKDTKEIIANELDCNFDKFVMIEVNEEQRAWHLNYYDEKKKEFHHELNSFGWRPCGIIKTKMREAFGVFCGLATKGRNVSIDELYSLTADQVRNLYRAFCYAHAEYEDFKECQLLSMNTAGIYPTKDLK